MGKLAAILKTLRHGPTLPAPQRKAARHLPTLFGKMAMERWLLFSRVVPPNLEMLAQLRAGTLVGCPW